MNTDLDICTVLRDEAKCQVLSACEISRRTGLNLAGVSRTLKGQSRPRTDTVFRILAALGHDLTWLQGQLDKLKTRKETDGVAQV
jgi:transcriptional regulator with XRE-family HTH domain